MAEPFEVLGERSHELLLAALGLVRFTVALDEHALRQRLLDRDLLHGVGAEPVQACPGWSRPFSGELLQPEDDHLARDRPVRHALRPE